MNLINYLQKAIDYQQEEQRHRFESIGFKKDEALKFENFAQTCYDKIYEIETDIEINKIDIGKVQAIIDTLKGERK